MHSRKIALGSDSVFLHDFRNGIGTQERNDQTGPQTRDCRGVDAA